MRHATTPAESALAHGRFLALALLLAACTGARTPPVAAPDAVVAPHSKLEQPTFAEVGMASWYGAELQDSATASGEPFNPQAMTAAHPSLPFGTIVRVTSVETGQTVKVKVNDRGPFAQGRVIDLSVSAAEKIGLTQDSEAKVRIEEFASDQP